MKRDNFKDIPIVRLNKHNRRKIIDRVLNRFIERLKNDESYQLYIDNIEKLKKIILKIAKKIDISNNEIMQKIPYCGKKVKSVYIDRSLITINGIFLNYYPHGLLIKLLSTRKIKIDYYRDMLIGIPELDEFKIPNIYIKNQKYLDIEKVILQKGYLKEIEELKDCLGNIRGYINDTYTDIEQFNCAIEKLVNSSYTLRSICRKIEGSRKILKPIINYYKEIEERKDKDIQNEKEIKRIEQIAKEIEINCNKIGLELKEITSIFEYIDIERIDMRANSFLKLLFKRQKYNEVFKNSIIVPIKDISDGCIKIYELLLKIRSVPIIEKINNTIDGKNILVENVEFNSVKSIENTKGIYAISKYISKRLREITKDIFDVYIDNYYTSKIYKFRMSTKLLFPEIFIVKKGKYRGYENYREYISINKFITMTKNIIDEEIIKDLQKTTKNINKNIPKLEPLAGILELISQLDIRNYRDLERKYRIINKYIKRENEKRK